MRIRAEWKYDLLEIGVYSNDKSKYKKLAVISEEQITDSKESLASFINNVMSRYNVETISTRPSEHIEAARIRIFGKV